MTATLHFSNRRERIQFIKDNIGIGEVVRTFKVDKGHPNGPELHSLTTTGIIIIRNAYTKKLVTLLIARPGQVRRYFPNGEAPKDILRLAKEHMDKGWNEI